MSENKATTNVPWVESVLVIAAFTFVGILGILALGLDSGQPQRVENSASI